ncbi:MAG: hypothetical protein U0R80_18975 [Nocardioidaceae bacterium]
MTTDESHPPAESGCFEIRLRGRLDDRWAAWLDGLAIAHDPDGTTVLRGRVTDQTALHGVLARLRDIGLPLVSVTPVDPTDASCGTDHPDPTHPDPNGARP